MNSINLVKYLLQKSSQQIHHTLIHLRPCELSETIFTIKVLKHYNKIDNIKIKSFENALEKLFIKTPYPFTWNINYKQDCEYISRKKKVLFYFHRY